MIEKILNYPFLEITVLGNTAFVWLTAAGVFLLVLLALKIFKTILIVKLKRLAGKTKTDIDDMVINAIEAIHWPFYVLVSLYVALHFMEVSPSVQQWAYYIILIAVIYYAIKFVQQFIDFGAEKILIKKKDSDVGAIKIISGLLKISLWGIAALLTLSNLGYNVSSLIAGLGIGGLAIALALQNVLGDIFSSFSIYFDKPFRVGDFIVIGDYKGTVEKIGIKTTRIRSNMGEEIIISNQELTSAKVRNYKRMNERRNVFNIGVTYDTPAKKLKLIPGMIKNIIESAESTRFDRVHFSSYGDFSLNFEISYYTLTTDYARFMDIKQVINLAIVEEFGKERIDMAFPTQTVYIKK